MLTYCSKKRSLSDTYIADFQLDKAIISSEIQKKKISLIEAFTRTLDRDFARHIVATYSHLLTGNL